MPLSTILLLAFLAILVVIAIVVLIRTLSFPVELGDVDPIELPAVDGESVAQRLGLAIQLKTVSSRQKEKIDTAAFRGMIDLLHTLYPSLDEHLHREIINDYALLYTWEGSDPSLEPVAFLAHMDVVPAEDSSNWKYPPFSGTLAEGYVWGRGALDCKGTLITILEAADALLREAYQPLRTIYLAFGYDEEITGLSGAGKLSEHLKSKGQKFSFILDEGGAITQGLLKSLGDTPIAAIGIAEKGVATLKLHANTTAGHASTPAQSTAIGALALAVATLESNPFPQHLDLFSFMMSYIGKTLPFVQRMALANTWLFGGMVRKSLEKNPLTNALTRTTIAPTIICGGKTDNVLPAEADAYINIRILGGETREEALERIQQMVEDNIISVLPARGETLSDQNSSNPSPISTVDSAQFALLANLIRATFPGTQVMPMMDTGATDARYYTSLSRNTFRFSPFLIGPEDYASIHGVNERLSIENCAKSVGFLMMLMREVSSLTREDEANFEQEYEEDEPEGSEAEEIIAAKPKAQATRHKAALSPEEKMIEEMNTPLQTKPMKQSTAQPKAQSIAYPKDPVPYKAQTVAYPSEAPVQESKRAVEDLPSLPENDEPLVTKPMKK